MKNIEIYIIGNYDFNFRASIWTYYLSYKKAVIKRTGLTYENWSRNRADLQALHNALQHVIEPCKIKIYSKTRLGFDKPRLSSNKDLIVDIMSIINKEGHIVEYVFAKEMPQVDIWEQLYGTPINTSKQSNIENKPDIKYKKTPNDVFSRDDDIIKEQAMQSHDWREMYNDLMDSNNNTWVPGSGGY